VKAEKGERRKQFPSSCFERGKLFFSDKQKAYPKERGKKCLSIFHVVREGGDRSFSKKWHMVG